MVSAHVTDAVLKMSLSWCTSSSLINRCILLGFKLTSLTLNTTYDTFLLTGHTTKRDTPQNGTVAEYTHHNKNVAVAAILMRISCVLDGIALLGLFYCNSTKNLLLPDLLPDYSHCFRLPAYYNLSNLFEVSRTLLYLFL